jgi:hypothetical protein
MAARSKKRSPPGRQRAPDGPLPLPGVLPDEWRWGPRATTSTRIGTRAHSMAIVEPQRRQLGPRAAHQGPTAPATLRVELELYGQDDLTEGGGRNLTSCCT